MMTAGVIDDREYTPAPLTPARAELSARILAVRGAVAEVEAAREPISFLQRVGAGAVVDEHRAIQNEINRLRSEHDAALNVWVSNGAHGARPVPAFDLIECERRQGQLAADAESAIPKLAAAQRSATAANLALGAASRDRDAAVIRAVVEASTPALSELESTITKVLKIEGRLKGLVDELRSLGGRTSDTAPMAAAERIEAAILVAKRRPCAAIDSSPARRLLEALKTDPHATL